MKRVAIHSVPRSGSTWLGSIFDSHPSTVYKLQPLFSYALKDRLSERSSLNEIDEFFFDLEKVKDEFMDQRKEKILGLIPEFHKSKEDTLVYKEVRYHHIINNLLQKDDSIKVIGLIRNPLNVISSWQKAPKEFRTDLGWKIEEEWLNAPKKNVNQPEEFNGYRKWKEVAQNFLFLKNEYPENFYLLSYENLLHNPKKEVSKVFSFCGLDLTEQTLSFLKLSTQTNNPDPYSVFKSKKRDDQWKQDLPKYIIEEIKNDPDFKKLNRVFHWI